MKKNNAKNAKASIWKRTAAEVLCGVVLVGSCLVISASNQRSAVDINIINKASDILLKAALDVGHKAESSVKRDALPEAVVMLRASIAFEAIRRDVVKSKDFSDMFRLASAKFMHQIGLRPAYVENVISQDQERMSCATDVVNIDSAQIFFDVDHDRHEGRLHMPQRCFTRLGQQGAHWYQPML